MRCLGRIIALAVLLIMVLLIPCATWSIAIWNVVGDDETYTQTFNRSAYEKIAPVTIPMLSQIAQGHLEENDQEARELAFFLQMLDFIDIERWREISATIVTPEWVESELGGFMSETLTYLHGESDVFDPVIDVTDIRTRLAGRQGQIFVESLMREIRTWDTCTPEQALTYQEYFDGGGNATVLPKCQLPSMNDEIQEEMTRAVGQIAGQLPADGRYQLRREILSSGEATEDEYNLFMRDSRQGFVFLDNALVPIAFLSILMFISIIVIVAVRSLKEFFLWTGLAFVIGGLLNVIPLFSFLYSVSKPLQEEIAVNTLERLFIEANFEIARSLTGSITLPILTVTFTLVLLGFIFLVLAAVVKNTPASVQQFYYVPGGTPTPTPSPFASAIPPIAPPQIRDDRTTITPPPLSNTGSSTGSSMGSTSSKGQNPPDLEGQTYIESRSDNLE